MFLATKARLKIKNNDKLLISRRPGIVAWLLLGFSIFVLIVISRRLTENFFTLTISVFGGIMFGLDKLGDWEDFVLDKSKNQATFTRCNWSEKLCFIKGGVEKSTISMKLSEIRHVGVSVDLGLFVLLKNGRTISLSTNGLCREEIQKMRQEINEFLNLTRIEYLDKLPNPEQNLRDRLVIPSSDSEDEIVALESNKLITEKIKSL